MKINKTIIILIIIAIALAIGFYFNSDLGQGKLKITPPKELDNPGNLNYYMKDKSSIKNIDWTRSDLGGVDALP